MTTTPGLVLSGLHKTLGGRTIVDALDLAVAKGELVSLLGPSGCGKTTTLRMVAGFLTPDGGRITIDGRDVTALRPERRPTAMVFQNYALWPHMSVFDNVAFPLKLRRLPKSEVRERVGAVLELVGLSHHLRSRPARISGGEQQRVALARAVVQEPKVLRLDEPLSNLDAPLRVRVREEIREIQQRLGITTLIVTHDQDEALSVSDRVAVMNGGRIEQCDAPAELYRTPATSFVGGFVGATNIVPGRLQRSGEGWELSVGDARLTVGETNLADSGSGDEVVSVRPEDVTIVAGSQASVLRVIPRGHFSEVVAAVGEHHLRAYVDTPAVPQPGDDVGLHLRRALAYRDGVLA